MQALAPFTRDSLLALLGAAASSPTAMHRQPSIEYALYVTLTRKRHGLKVVLPTHLPAILDAAREAAPALATLEDWVPLDPRLPVTARWGDARFRLHPGAQERPLANVVRAELVADAVDRVLLPHHGFRLVDTVEISLRLADAAIRRFEAVWPVGPIPMPDDTVTLRAEEISVAAEVSDATAVLSACSDAERATRALAWATRTPKTLRYRPDDPTAAYGPVVAVRLEDGRLHALPVGLQSGACASAVQTLADEAARLDPSCDDRFRERSDVRVAHLLARMGGTFVPAPTVAGAGSIHSLGLFSERHALVIGVASGLRHDDLLARVEEMSDVLQRVQPGAAFHASAIRGEIPTNVELTRLLVVSNPGHLVIQGDANIVTITLDDLDWMARTGDGDDLFRFCRDYIDTHRQTILFMLEAMNAWEWWRGNGKAFHRAGDAPGLIVGVHFTDAEWKQAAEAAPAEETLFALGLPPLRNWEVHEVEGDWVRLVDRRTGVLWSVVREPLLTAVRYQVGPQPARDDFHITQVGDALIHALRRLPDTAIGAVAAALGEGTPLRLSFLPKGNPPADAPPLRFAGVDAGIILVAWDARMWDEEERHRGTIQSLLGDTLVRGLAALAPNFSDMNAHDLRGAWTLVPPVFSLDVIPIPHRVTDLPRPTTASDAARSEIRRELAAHLREADIAPKMYEGREAATLESRVLYPRLTSMLQTACAPYSLDGLLAVTTYELECASARRVRRRWELEANVRAMPVEYDPATQAFEDEGEGSSLARSLATVVEHALRNPPSGSLAPDRVAWTRILACAELLVESGLRSEGIHYGVIPVGIEVTDQHEIRGYDDGSPLFDAPAYQRAQMAHRLPSTRDADAPTGDPTEEPDEPTDNGLLAAMPQLRGIDAALRSSIGCGIESLTGVLVRLREWLATLHSPVGRATAKEIIAFCTDDGSLPAAEIEAAVEALTLRGEDLRGEDLETWEFSKRVARLAARPLIAGGDGTVFVLPWFIGESLRIYAQYLEDGRLPWSERAMDETLKAALNAYRQSLNVALEREVGDLLGETGMTVRLNVKKPHVIGLRTLSGEIDAVAARPDGNTLWVVEVKDPVRVFSVSEMERGVRAFHDPVRGYIPKLLRKIADVGADPDAVARQLGVPSNVRRVRGVMVTRRSVPAAYVGGTPVPFMTVAELTKWIAGEEDASGA